MISKIELGYFKSYFQSQEIEITVPDIELQRPGLTVIVGPNNSGKSTILTALKSMLMQQEQIIFDQSERHSGQKPIVSISFQKDGKSYELVCQGGTDDAYLDKKFIQVEQNDERKEVSGNWNQLKGSLMPRIRYVPSRRVVDDKFTPTTKHSSEQLDQQALTPHTAAPLGHGLHALTVEGQKANFDELLRSILADMSDWTIDRINGRDVIVYKTKSGQSHMLSLLGDGFTSIFRLVYTLFRSKPGEMIILDEPELSLHPQAQRRLYKTLRNLAFDRQIIVATHSPYFVSWIDLIANVKLHRVSKSNDGKARASSLRSDTVGAIAGVVQHDAKNRKLYDTFAKEVFFADKTVFTEGQEDVHILDNYLEGEDREPLPFFGYGSGGASHIKNWLSMARDLQITAVGLYDGDQAELANAASEAFKDTDTINVVSLEKDDIRDKHLRDGKCTTNGNCNEKDEIVKQGYFDKMWNVKPELKDELDGILGQIRSLLDVTTTDML